MLTDWSDTPPTVPGWYWLKSRLRGEPFLSQLTTGGVWQTGSARATSSYMARHYQFGSRIPSSAELLAMHKQIATLTAERDAAEAELEAATQRLIDQEVA